MHTLLKTLAVSFGLSLSIVLTAVFMVAAGGGGSVTVYVNQYGEMIPELLLLMLVVWPIMSVALTYALEPDWRGGDDE